MGIKQIYLHVITQWSGGFLCAKEMIHRNDLWLSQMPHRGHQMQSGIIGENSNIGECRIKRDGVRGKQCSMLANQRPIWLDTPKCARPEKEQLNQLIPEYKPSKSPTPSS